MGNSTSSCQRECEALEFLLFKTTAGGKEVFEEVPERTLQPGDIVLFHLRNNSGHPFSSSFKHVVIYCGDGEVIHFQNTSSKISNGRISKESFRAMKNKRGKFQIYRKKGGIDLKDFRSKVREAMNSEASYHFSKNNCIHFALYLLGLVEFYKELVQVQNEGDSSGGGANICSPSIPELQKTNQPEWSQETEKAMERESGKFQIYQKKGRIDFNDFHSKVRETMNSEVSYHSGKNIYLSFSFYLLDMEFSRVEVGMKLGVALIAIMSVICIIILLLLLSL